MDSDIQLGDFFFKQTRVFPELISTRKKEEKQEGKNKELFCQGE
jgi:hypothetical protein